MSDFEPFYDVNRTYEDNYAQGPFGAFAQALAEDGAASAASADSASAAAQTETFLGQPVNLAFGIPAGPLLNSRYTTAAFRMGFDLATYKTVRSRAWGCNPFPNVLAVHPKSADGSLTPGSAELDEGVLADTNYDLPISISNSFGVPSQDPDVWQPDMKAAIAAAGPGQVLVPSFQGSRVEGMSEDDYIADHATTARLIKETGAKLMVMNTSCPNEGHNRLLCHNPLLVGRITEAVKQAIGDTPLMIKLAYIPSDDDLELMVRSTVGRGTVQGFSTINTISARLVDKDGNQALPGAGRDRSGVCGNAIRGAGLDMVARLAAIREKTGLDFAINGVGGVVSPADYAAYKKAGADSVMSATGAMWDAELAHKIKVSL
ncbi:diguanylate cyclase [Bifidobacterium miconisargentati]|uniref:diguanylate cyclase n=1 Tax=Bifidobacterium miconisargentati TaxID=2834437 RepID=UPI001BDD86AB|nr:diguanylate cyclase [Bifidobacterium miconisargentati]MBW3090513.1 diguanylate cyclase [Bifidobacterium miconisargentati]